MEVVLVTREVTYFNYRLVEHFEGYFELFFDGLRIGAFASFSDFLKFLKRGK